ncbi:hydroxymethylbilane synthase [Dolichospermum circinale]|uniref:hydroxymethylbilane synthase n=1 Tax=Dolichospermum circinale TaxID=109265 RepID=UPI00232E7EF2|nr:hydroxymethylbilane synthase [Dolichospermum circinale]MDB9456693.1 hydroxymethylbilane synthase [Dolichospermum circinale CS-541/06]MDB9462239.1 hydroxymethylbilane synthase [Dolichospermum circinale CS-541/04]MDB9548010.1 hydroxymethylbilane synthase [Dolichospermum circinale CS-1031]
MTSVSSPPRTIRIGSRKSQLALVQTYWVQAQLQKSFPDITFEVHTMSTQGDKILDVALAKIGDKGLFTKELELGMINKEIDFAVHSLKDLPTNLPPGLTLAAITERENPADAVVLHEKHQGEKLETLPAGALIGTSSLRRLAQLRHKFPHFIFKDVRGNLITRMAKLDAGEYDALILAVAGLERLEMSDRIHQILSPEISLHAVGQGALGIECRDDDTEVITLLKAIEHPQTRDRCLAERSFLRVLEGGCQVPIGVNTEVIGDKLTLKGLVASVDGQKIVQNIVTGAAADAEKLGAELADILRQQGATEILEQIFTEIQRGS